LIVPIWQILQFDDSEGYRTRGLGDQWRWRLDQERLISIRRFEQCETLFEIVQAHLATHEYNAQRESQESQRGSQEKRQRESGEEGVAFGGEELAALEAGEGIGYVAPEDLDDTLQTASRQLQAEDVARLLLWRHRMDTPDQLDAWLENNTEIQDELRHVLENGSLEMKKHMEAPTAHLALTLALTRIRWGGNAGPRAVAFALLPAAGDRV
jgi:hypothetical protein